MPSIPRTPRFAPLIEHREALLRLLAAPAPSGEEIATIVLRDAGLLHAILAAAPLARQRLGNSLREEVVQRLALLGDDLLRSWLLQQSWSGPAGDARSAAASSHALLVAECALHLALETRYPYPDEAYLAGLWHNLGSQCLEAATAATSQPTAIPSPPRDVCPPREDHRQAGLSAFLAGACGVSAPLADAIAFGDALEERALAAHPLARLLWAARRLAQADWRDSVRQVGPACGLAHEALLSLRTDVTHLAAQRPARPATPEADGMAAMQLALPGPAGDAMRELILGGLVRGAFSGLDGSTAAARLALGCRLLCDSDMPLMVFADEHDRLQALSLTDGDGTDLAARYAELGQRLDDEASVIALAARTGSATAWYAADGPARSPRDWHVARWLGNEGIVCLPLRLPQAGAVAVVGAAPCTPLAPGARHVLSALAAAAAAGALAACRTEAAREEAAARVEAHYRAHARRIAHEAGNPLSVIKSHLALMAQRESANTGARNALEILHVEVDRIASLLQDAGHPPPEQPEAAVCQVPELLQELQTLYGEALFGCRGIRFEVRTAERLPPVAMPGTALRQVLLNLFRNAAEALQPGGRFLVTLPGMVQANGVSCLELRLIDNGPGLPAERLADLFSPRPSDKGDTHQGLGLSIVREILQQWHAFVLCRSHAGVGTSFQLLIPLDKSA